MAVLYRKYRPQTFGEVLGQKYIIQTLKNQVAKGQVAHAYLFTGGRGVGKTSVARILAKAVNCLKPADGEPCDKCANCQQIVQGHFLDLVEIDAASNTGVDNIREVIEHVKFSPSSGKFKVFIIDEVHMLSKGAFNALLKTLEEPPKHAIFILATTEAGKVPATIVSRTQKFDFKALAAADIEKHLHKVLKLEKLTLEPEIIELVAQNALGSVRDAFSLLDKVLTLGDKPSLEECQQLLGVTDITVCENLLELITQAESSKIPEFLDNLTERGLDFSILTRDFLEYLRKVLVFKISGKIPDLTEPEHQEKLKNLADKLAPNEIIYIVRLFLKAYKDLNVVANPQIPIMLASLEASFRPGVLPQKQNESKENNNNHNNQPSQTEPSPPPKHFSKPPTLTSEIEPQLPETDASVTLEEVQEHWQDIIEKIKDVNYPLANLIKHSTLQDVSQGRVVLGVKFLFHKQNLENKKNCLIFFKACEEALGKHIGLTAQVLKNGKSEDSSPEEVITDALKIFGGELVD